MTIKKQGGARPGAGRPSAKRPRGAAEEPVPETETPGKRRREEPVPEETATQDQTPVTIKKRARPPMNPDNMELAIVPSDSAAIDANMVTEIGNSHDVFAMENKIRKNFLELWDLRKKQPFDWLRYGVVDKKLEVYRQRIIIAEETPSSVCFEDVNSKDTFVFRLDYGERLVQDGHGYQKHHGAPTQIVCKQLDFGGNERVYCVTNKYPDMPIHMPFDYNPNSLVTIADEIIKSSGYDEMHTPLMIGNKFTMIPNWNDGVEQSDDDLLKTTGQLMKWEIVAEDDDNFYFKYQYFQYTKHGWYPEIVTEFFEIYKEPSPTEEVTCMEKYAYFKDLKDTWDSEDTVEVKNIGKVALKWHDEFLQHQELIKNKLT